MRKHQQRQILDLLQKTKQAQSAGLYADCQDAVSAIYDFIESIKGEGTQTAAFLKEYYEALFKANNGEIGIKDLKKHLFKIENCIKDELKPDRIEISFLSYIASMSDSIESIYLAAKDDPNCDAYWIPIPWFERNSDGSLGTLHFEGSECYSNNIECTDWQQYDIAARHPDVIVSFAPYDAINYVTTVHPDFYFERLRNLTDLLVYVPYFVVDENAPLPEHFCTLPGCVYAHKVIVQSEKIRDIYIHTFKKAYGNKLGKPEDKFIALGSPKFDKVINTKKEDCNLPDEWNKIINGRKVIFYNTSIGALLKGNEQYLKKLRCVLETFKNRNNIVLWWRPHPLNEATYKTMRPHLLDEYNQIIEEYRRDNWGIFDDKVDLHRAIAISSAYIGDNSSLVKLFQVLGKPALIQNIQNAKCTSNMGHSLPNAKIHFEKQTEQYPEFFSFHIEGDELFFYDRIFDAICKLYLSNGTIECLGNLESTQRHIFIKSMTKCGNKLYLAPLRAKEIIIFDLTTQKFKLIKYTNNESSNNGFCYSCLYQKWIFFFPYRYSKILRYDIENETFDEFDDYLPKFHLYQTDDKDAYFLSGKRIGESVFLASCCGNALIQFDMDNCISTVYEIGNKANRYALVSYDGAYFWLTPRRDTNIVKWNIEKGLMLEIPNPAINPTTDKMPFISNFAFDNYIWLYSAFSETSFKIDVTTGNLEEISTVDPSLKKNDTNQSYYIFAHDDNGMYLTYNIEHILKIHTKNRSEDLQLRYEADLLKKIKQQKYKRKIFDTSQARYVKENETFMLEDFLEFAVTQKEITRPAQCYNFNSGIAIYDYCKNWSYIE